ncbi:hypothetical protein ACHWQZ_G017650 [Mnemiopsis leidyi]
MKAGLSLLLLFSLFKCTFQNDHRDFAIVRAHCRRLCADEYSNSQLCLEQCSLSRACSLQNCHLFCDPGDSLCLKTCKCFVDARVESCDKECLRRPDVVVEDIPGTASINVSVTLDESVKSHVILLNQINRETGTNLTYDSSYNESCTFTGLYPWFQYQIDVVSLSSSCCTSSRLWIGTVSFNVTGAEFFMLEDKKMSKIEFYPYPLPPSWIDTNKTGRVSKNTELIPDLAVYNISSRSWSRYESTRKINEKNVGVMGGEQVEELGDFHQACHSRDTLGTDFYCVYRGFGMGYLFRESLGSSSPPSVFAIDSNNNYMELGLTIKPRETCKYFSWISHKNPLDLKLNCSQITTASGNSSILEISYRKDLAVLIRVCYMSDDQGSRKIDRHCCPDQGVACIWNETAKALKNLSEKRSYLLYFFNGTDNSTCKKDLPCDGFYQRIDPQKIKKCPKPLPLLAIILIVSGLGLVSILGAVMLFLWKFKFGNVKHAKELNIPWDGQGLGGELSREAISKESYLDRGNFGYILGGKLKVKLDGKDELTKQYDVALKILKTKVEKSEDVAETEENIKDAKKAMKAEIHIMKQIQGSGRDINDHVLRMYGYVVDAPPYILVLELCVTNLTKYLRRLRIQIENKTLSPEEVQVGTVLSLDDHKNSITQRDQDKDLAARESRGLSRSRGGYRDRERTDSLRSRTETLVSQSVVENTLKIQRPRVLSRGTQGNTSSYNDSVHGRMARQEPSMDRFKDTVLTTTDLLSFCRQVSSGMDFLHSIELIHRDLAADNVLLKEKPGGELVVKICDFGQSRMLYNGKYVCSGDTVTDRQRMFRLRWTAPEIKQDPKKWSKFSDVWSYGVLMWEVFTLGGIPYPGWPDHHVLDNLLSGMRMKQPPCCNDQVWRIAMRCWDQNTEARGEFNEIKLELDKIMCEERDKELGVRPSDYTFCDVPTEDETKLVGSIDEVELNLMETDEPAVPLDLRHGSFSELSPAGDCTVLQNGAAVEQNSRYRTEELRIAVDVNNETVKISANDIAQF